MSIHATALSARLNTSRLLDRCRNGRDLAAKQADSAAAGLISSSAGSIPDPAGSAPRSGNQLRHFRGHQFSAISAISAIAKRIAGQQIHVGRQPTAGGMMTKSLGDDVESLPVHPLLDAIDNPNPVHVRWALMYSTVASLELTGTAYWWFTESVSGTLDIWPIPPTWIEPADHMRTAWKVRPFGQASPIVVPGEFIAPFVLPDPSDPFGCVSPLQAQAAAIDADEAIQNSQVAAFRNGIKPGVVITTGTLPGPPGRPEKRPHLTPEQRSQLIKAIQNAYRGVHQHNDPIILDGLIDSISQFSMKPAEMDWLASGKQTRGRIMAAFGVNPLLLGEIEGANRAQAVVAENSFCENVVSPLLDLMSQVLTRHVGPLFATPNERLVIWIEKCTANDRELRQREWKTAINKGYVTPNEYRRNVLNLPDHPDGDELPSTPLAISPAVRKALPQLNPFTMRRLTAPTNGQPT